MLLMLGGLTAIGIGAYAWTQQRTDVVRLTPATPVELRASPLFDPGSTIFALGEDRDPAEPKLFGCSLLREGREAELLVRPDVDSVGTRVLRGEPYVPVVVLGTTVVGDSVTCNPTLAAGEELAVMPTDVGVRSVPLAFVVGGIAALGIAGLIHPRGRGIRRFGS
ncbi:hypothetical protein N803_11285 [Knoellia subterranea KCTC 19937]|uniref:Uncharacterized protein n=2 Tax=Knoellia TaxID=136099 RepID=A0A0A0JNM0_9MICO|nr:hypothetical protein N803_11285 [Knoellia subterranea KCTC 19937]